MREVGKTVITWTHPKHDKIWTDTNMTLPNPYICPLGAT